ncbi:MAG: DUF4190 domain-containing protein [Labilithrix sp.]|nr:DUF4190 domain-containing protein [Labilithrix sp.]
MSLVLGLVSLGCVGPLAGLPAIVLGSLARRDIDRSRGTLTGRAVAAGGIVSGLFGTGLASSWRFIMGAAFAPETDEDAPPAIWPRLPRPPSRRRRSPPRRRRPRAARTPTARSRSSIRTSRGASRSSSRS